MISDLMIYESGDGGNLRLLNDDLSTIQSITNQVYLALFGGNTEQSTSSSLSEIEQRNDYWGNEYLEDEFQFNSIFEKTINEVVLTSGGISTLEDAAKEDLKYLEKYADITISGSIPQFNRFTLLVELQEPDSDSVKVKFIWDGTRKELIETIII